MEYYICLEEDRICYVRGRFKRCAGSGLRRCLEIVEWEFVEPVPDVASALTRLAEKYGMEGKRVNLIVGRDVRMMGFISGNTILKNMEYRPAPSMAAASSNSLGILFTNPDTSSTVNAIWNPILAMMNP